MYFSLRRKEIIVLQLLLFSTAGFSTMMTLLVEWGGAVVIVSLTFDLVLCHVDELIPEGTATIQRLWIAILFVVWSLSCTCSGVISAGYG